MAKVPCRWCGTEYDERGIHSHEAACDRNPANEGPAPVEEQDDEPDADPEPDPDPEPDDANDDADAPEVEQDDADDAPRDYDPTDALDPTDDDADATEVEQDDADDDEEPEYECAECGGELEYLEETCPNCGVRPAWSLIEA